MRLRLRQRPKDEDERILPLINIVFLLLIFFMVLGKISASDPFEISPVLSSSKGTPPVEPLLVQVGSKGELALNGAVMDELALVAAVEAAIREDATALVRLKADGEADALFVVMLMERLRVAGVKGVRFMTAPLHE